MIVEPSTQGAVARVTEPEYPLAERREGHQGTVTFEATVGTDGRVQALRVTQSSGYPALDASAAREIQRYWRLAPGTADGVPTEMKKEMAFTFRLTGDEAPPTGTPASTPSG